MGEPKALVEVDGVPMAARVAAALRAGGCERVVLVGGDPGWADLLGLDAVPDRWPGEGPLAGTATALLAAQDGIVVVAACDQPWLDGPTVDALVGAVTGHDAHDVAVGLDDDGRPLPFPAAWRARCAPGLVDLVEAGERRAGAGPRSVRHIAVAVGPEQVRDVDRPADLAPGPADDRRDRRPAGPAPDS
jgi:molybdopterin-guanine dinucleotide biosynthesis protein A